MLIPPLLGISKVCSNVFSSLPVSEVNNIRRLFHYQPTFPDINFYNTLTSKSPGAVCCNSRQPPIIGMSCGTWMTVPCRMVDLYYWDPRLTNQSVTDTTSQGMSVFFARNWLNGQYWDPDSNILVKLQTLTLCWNDPDLVSLRTSSDYETVFSYTDCRHTSQVLTWPDETQTFTMFQLIHMQRAVLMIGYEQVSNWVEHDMLRLIGEIMLFLFMLGDMRRLKIGL